MQTLAGRTAVLRPALLGLGLVVASCAEGQTLAGPPLSLAELTARSDLVVVGEVVSVRSEWKAGRSEIVTRVDVREDEVLKGRVAGGAVSLEEIGGRVGDVTGVLAGAPAFTRGERVLLFLSVRAGRGLGVTGLFQGKFALERDPASGEEVAVRRLPGTARTLDRIPLSTAREVIGRVAGG